MQGMPETISDFGGASRERFQRIPPTIINDIVDPSNYNEERLQGRPNSGIEATYKRPMTSQVNITKSLQGERRDQMVSSGKRIQQQDKSSLQRIYQNVN